MAELSGLLWWNFAYILILTRCSPRDCQNVIWDWPRRCRNSNSEKQWDWPILLKRFEYFDKIMHRHCYWRELDRGIAKCHLSSVEVQILKNKWIWPFQRLEHFDMHLSKFWKKKKKLKRTLYIYMWKKKKKKKCADTLRLVVFGSAILHFRM